MIDTVGIRIPNSTKINIDNLTYTGNFKIYRNNKKRIDKSVADYNYKNFHIEISNNENDKRPIFIYGSLQKLVDSQNYNENSITDIRQEIKIFSDTLGVNLFSQKVLRVDVCQDFKVNDVDYFLENIFAVEKYYPRYYSKAGNTRYFEKWDSKKYLTVCFYNKSNESTINDNNILRHEIRLFQRFLMKINIKSLKDIFDCLDVLNCIRKDNMKEFKVTERKKFKLTGTKRDLVLLAREIGTEKILKQIKEEFNRKLISRRTQFNRKKVIRDNQDLIENQEYESLKIINKS
ncbi:MAG: hypothetical protein K8S23_10555 [Candidatus Cloacimonetes bacterium]|nr:hypothetical protein [Candidatus Cloacimonadota bacterium]